MTRQLLGYGEGIVLALTQQENAGLTGLSKQLVTLYREVKSHVIRSEKLSQDSRISVPALNELRNAFDHNMRADAVWRHGESLPKGVETDVFRYCEKNIEKAIGHVYRAGYDALDIIALNKIRRIKKYVDDFRITTLHTVIDDYTGKIRQPFREAIKSCNDAKLGKDVEPEEIQQHPQFFGWYTQAISILDGVLDVYESHEEDLLAVEKEVASSDQAQRDIARLQRNLAILFGIGSIVTAVIIYCVSG
ncbi:MAG: hypothetical protein HN350_03575 [Phycisphaerales bacterium]|nr:hypothetical protein [Phycisphaerales bacterium]